MHTCHCVLRPSFFERTGHVVYIRLPLMLISYYRITRVCFTSIVHVWLPNLLIHVWYIWYIGRVYFVTLHLCRWCVITTKLLHLQLSQSTCCQTWLSDIRMMLSFQHGLWNLPLSTKHISNNISIDCIQIVSAKVESTSRRKDLWNIQIKKWDICITSCSVPVPESQFWERQQQHPGEVIMFCHEGGKGKA